MPESIYFRTADHPQANGREAQEGERQYDLFFPLEDGTELHVLMGIKGMTIIRNLALEELVDDESAGGN